MKEASNFINFVEKVHRKFLEGKTVWIHRIVFAKIG